MTFQRPDNRSSDSLRPIIVGYDIYGYADAAVLFEQGNTKVLVGIILQQTVPHFLKGQKTGWLSAEYAMLPHATHQRTNRESSQVSRNARSVEISRLIGRCLRPTIDLHVLGERSIIVDCDVLQADGGTRVACITAASIALTIAAQRWMAAGIIEKNIIKEKIAAVSVGVVSGQPLLDLTYDEDSSAEADFNIILTQHGDLVEIQGTSEKKVTAWDLFNQLTHLAQQGITQIFEVIKKLPQPSSLLPHEADNHKQYQTQKTPAFFSIAHRLQKK